MDIEIREYETRDGNTPFGKWFDGLNPQAAAKISISVDRIQAGNWSNVKRIESIYEYKLNWGPGYRIYFAKEGQKVVILLGGGTKKRQSKEIKSAKEHWRDYQNRK